MVAGSVTFRPIAFVTILLVPALVIVQIAAAQTPPLASLAPGQSTPSALIDERVIPADPATTWEKMIVALQTIAPPGDLQQSRNLFEHPHGNAKLNKAGGKITTPTFRYFKILSAGFPPMERDYRDTYLISLASVESSSSPTLVRIERKFEVYDTVKSDWVKADPLKEHVGVPIDVLFATLEAQMAPPPAPTQGQEGLGASTLSSEIRTP